MSCGCQLATQNTGPVWRPSDNVKPTPSRPNADIYRPDILQNIEETLKELDGELRALSLDIHAHPELKYVEYYAHDVLTEFIAKHGFEVTKHYHLETAWRALFTNGEGGRTIGVNSEMDALPGIGHACGHNLIAISGVGVAIAIQRALQKFNIPGKVELLGTPAEEGGDGKVILLEKGAYKDIASSAHASLSPWEGKNALDAAVLGYNNISALRQQLLPTHRVHGIIEGKDWVPGIIPDYAKMLYGIRFSFPGHIDESLEYISCYVRAPTRTEAQATLTRVLPCFEAAALATGCEVNITVTGSTFDLRQNSVLGDEVANITTANYGTVDYEWGIKSASTDFGNVTYALPSLHPGFAIPTVEDGGNHTIQFAESATASDAHYACLDVTKALAATGVRVLLDDEFFAKVKEAYDEDAEIQSIFAGK
ncbi:hypothetical protein C0995_013787 [Termitomyces sp. Mi166|nr:hypothetical protein C0995_013787 [Termitomyces sp. Mi166\